MAIRTINDQLLLLERVFLDPIQLYIINNAHLIQTPEGLNALENQTLIGLVDSLSHIFNSTQINGESLGIDLTSVLENGLKPKLSILVHAIQNAADIINNVVV